MTSHFLHKIWRDQIVDSLELQSFHNPLGVAVSPSWFHNNIVNSMSKRCYEEQKKYKSNKRQQVKDWRSANSLDAATSQLVGFCFAGKWVTNCKSWSWWWVRKRHGRCVFDIASRLEIQNTPNIIKHLGLIDMLRKFRWISKDSRRCMTLIFVQKLDCIFLVKSKWLDTKSIPFLFMTERICVKTLM